jgi:N-acetylglucosaminyldiphosphoundecaprenol N-acetyl-beta-D-mannosaminyltransferase
MIHNSSLEDACEILHRRIDIKNDKELDGILANSELGGWFTTLNVDVLRQLTLPENSGIKKVVLEKSWITADGAPIRLLSQKLNSKEKMGVVTGNLIWEKLLTYSEAAGRTFIFAGGSEDAQEACEKKAKEFFPNLHFISVGLEMAKAPNSLPLKNLLDKHNNAVVMVGIGALKQERLISNLVGSYPKAIFVGCGAAGNFYGEVKRRAPKVFQSLGLEWFFRLMVEPQRLFRRYVLEDFPFLIKLCLSLINRKITS